MKLHKFFGETSRAVLQQVRRELGADAMIVANRSVADGIEITAMRADAIGDVLGAAAAQDAPPPPPRQPIRAEELRVETPPPAPAKSEPVRWTPPSVSAPPAVHDEAAVAYRAPSARRDDEPVFARHDNEAVFARRDDAAAILRRDDELPTVGGHEAPAPARRADDAATARLFDEVAALRKMLEGQLAQLAWSDVERRSPLRAQLTRDLLASGYSASLAREITGRLPDDYAQPRALQWVGSVLAKNLRCTEDEGDLVTRGGVCALVGPTGVGKTTTVAKLAARCAVRFGASSLALLTTDSYRVGAHDQLRIYAKILGVPVHTVSSADDLAQALASLAGKHLVLIDTVGMGQRDARVPEQTALLTDPRVRRVLVLNAAAQAETLQEVVDAYGDRNAADAEPPAIVTKLDETARPGHVLDAVIRNRLVLQFVTNGQRVPEDLHLANGSYLVHRSLRHAPATTAASPFALDAGEYALVASLAGAAHA